mmetsp:Transcript_18140/g.26549  ORF Transcript_18140/g.26549 Transcript_18140/m.26549 type:complete len:175 (-) Transcript_18140:578-1102(-)
MSVSKKLKSNTLGLTELARLEDLFLSSFGEAVEKGIPEDAAGLKRLRHDLESILTEANKRTKLLAIELTKIYDMVDDPPEIESMEDEVLLIAWKDKTMAEINELDELDKGIRAANAAAAAAAAAQPRPTPAARAHTGAKKLPPGKRQMRPWPDNVPFVYRDSMRIKFLLHAHHH